MSCRCTATTPYHSAQNILKTFRCSSIHSITLHVLILPDHNKPPSVSCTVMTVEHSLSGVTVSKFLDIDCMQITRSILRLCTCVMQSLDCPHNLKICMHLEIGCNFRILRMCNAILRLPKFSDCVEQSSGNIKLLFPPTI